MHVSRFWRRAVVVTCLAIPCVAYAGQQFPADAPTKELAQWRADKAANAHAHANNSCYRPAGSNPAKLAFCEQRGETWHCQAMAANHAGSCKSGYVRPVHPSAFRPEPGKVDQTRPPPPQPNKVTDGRVDENQHRVRVERVGSGVATTCLTVTVRDSRYQSTKRITKFDGAVTLKEGEVWQQDFHQWGAADWEVKDRACPNP
jgi:hypothetical protein